MSQWIQRLCLSVTAILITFLACCYNVSAQEPEAEPEQPEEQPSAVSEAAAQAQETAVEMATRVWQQELFVFRGEAYTTGILIQAAVIFIAVGIVIALLRAIVSRIERRRFTKEGNEIEEIVDEGMRALVEQTKKFFIFTVSLYFASKPLPLAENVDNTLRTITLIVLFLQIGIWLNGALMRTVTRFFERRRERDPSSASAFGIIRFAIKVAVWATILLLVLDIFVEDITALIAGFGIGGIAIAFALQNILSDVFCSVAIVLDKPFEVGDFIIVGNDMGSVEKIGIKTTRLRSLSGEQIVFSNADLLGSRVRNYKRMFERRILFSLGATYDTPPEKMEKAVDSIREIIEGIDDTRFDRSHFKGYGDFALQIETVYYVLVPDYNRYMDIQQEINLKIYRKFQELGIEFAFPTQTIHVSSTIADDESEGS